MGARRSGRVRTRAEEVEGRGAVSVDVVMP